MWIIKVFIKPCSIDSGNEQSPTCEVVHETKKPHFRNLLPNRFLPSSVGRTLEWRSGGCRFKPHWWQFLMKFIMFCVTLDLSDNLTEMRQISLLWKTRWTKVNKCKLFPLPQVCFLLQRTSSIDVTKINKFLLFLNQNGHTKMGSSARWTAYFNAQFQSA